MHPHGLARKQPESTHAQHGGSRGRTRCGLQAVSEVPSLGRLRSLGPEESTKQHSPLSGTCAVTKLPRGGSNTSLCQEGPECEHWVRARLEFVKAQIGPGPWGFCFGSCGLGLGRSLGPEPLVMQLPVVQRTAVGVPGPPQRSLWGDICCKF